MRLLGRILTIILAGIGLAVLVIIALATWAAVDSGPSLPDKVVLTLDLENAVVETVSDNPLAQLQIDGSYRLRDVIEALERAAADDRVTGLMATIGDASFGMARAQELRDAVMKFRQSGKPAVLFAETIGEFGAGTVEYYVATAFGQVWLQPSGDVSLTGFMAESPFLKGTFEKLEIKPQFSARHEYKSAIGMFTEQGFTKEHRESLTSLLDSWYTQASDGIAQARNLTPEAVRAAMDRAPLIAREALEAGLVDRLGYYDEALEAATVNGGEMVDIADYAAAAPTVETKDKIALIYGVGVIQRGKSQANPLSQSAVMGAETIAQALRDAVDDESVRAILFRVDSPGGSYVASDTVWREVQRAKAAGKPVIASLGEVAASGGYFVSMGANVVVAQPGSITGSIGVFAGKLALDEFWKKLGVSWDEVHIGANAPMWSANREFSPEAWARMEDILDRIYADFTAKAASGRGIDPQAMDRLARGRIWTGADARANGLVDELGGYGVALRLAKQAAGIPADQAVTVQQFPRPKAPLEFIAEIFRTGHVPSGGASAEMSRLVGLMRPLLRHLEAAEAAGGSLRMPPFEVR